MSFILCVGGLCVKLTVSFPTIWTALPGNFLLRLKARVLAFSHVALRLRYSECGTSSYHRKTQSFVPHNNYQPLNLFIVVVLCISWTGSRSFSGFNTMEKYSAFRDRGTSEALNHALRQPFIYPRDRRKGTSSANSLLNYRHGYCAFPSSSS